MNALFCKPVFIRTTDSKTGAVSKLRAMLGMILNWDIYLISMLEHHQLEMLTIAKQITWYFSHLQQKEQLSRPEYFLDNVMSHDRTYDAEILPLLFNQWFALPTTNAPSWYPEIAELLICDWFCIDNMVSLQSCNIMLQRSLYSHCFICSSNQSIPRKSGKIRSNTCTNICKARTGW